MNPSPVLVDGGNIASHTSTFGFSYLTLYGGEARETHRFIKMAKQAGVQHDGVYRYNRFTRTLRMFHVTFSGPQDAVDSLRAYIDSVFKDEEG